MALIPTFFLNCVVSIGIREFNRKIKWIATGFVAGRLFEEKSEGNTYHNFIVTNKHVLDGQTAIVVRFNSKDEKSALDYDVNLIEDGTHIWSCHPDPNVDVACFLINHEKLKIDNAEYSFFALDKHALNVEQMYAEGISEGDGIFLLGFPLGLVDEFNKHVIVRSGIIAKIKSTLKRQTSFFLIDTNNFPGNSGGPVIIKPELTSIEGTKSIDKASLIGIVKAYYLYEDENSGLALVEHIDSVKEVLDICYNTRLKI